MKFRLFITGIDIVYNGGRSYGIGIKYTYRGPEIPFLTGKAGRFVGEFRTRLYNNFFYFQN